MKRKLLLAAALSAAIAAPGMAAAADNQVQEIRDRGVLQACHAEAFPWAVKDPATNEWKGSDVEAANNLAEAMGVEVEHVDATWGTLIPSLEAGKCDIVMAPMFRTPERAMRILFSEPTGFETKSITIGPNAGVASYEELDQEGKVVVVTSGAADENFAKRYFQNAEVKALVTDKLSTLLVDVASGRADAMVTDTASAKKLVSENPSMNVSILEPDSPLDPQGYSYGIRKGEYHFLHLVNVWQEAAEQQGLKAQWSEMFSQ
ncbi:substrate-binding periplasmic protein [Afifella pfennigii]|uniref:substrate-binding periplasmic protein n=1 Tax=Afifella pfennigii TaxID=209897 RepID=UPI00054D57E2|nr:ABC transporter substrate-binding protein [Afifella pfennigii]